MEIAQRMERLRCAYEKVAGDDRNVDLIDELVEAERELLRPITHTELHLATTMGLQMITDQMNAPLRRAVRGN